jgi:ubiquinone/menaquinone biosynthesis C-methylase UbiE
MVKRLLKTNENPFHVNERLVFDKNKPNNRDFLYQEHISRYIFASQFVKSKKVLDIACGTAYGTAFLTRYKPNMVVGVDVSKEALNNGKENFQGILSLLLGDATNISFKKKAFDVVISFETLEHLMKYEQFISEISRVLTDEGLFIVSTPNKLAFSALDDLYSNKYHFKEFTLKEFYFLLGRYFSEIQLFGEGKMDMKYNTLRDIRKLLLKKTRFDPLKFYKLGNSLFNKIIKPADIFPLQMNEHMEPKFFIAVCKNKSARISP